METESKKIRGDFDISINISIDVDTSVLTKELMDNYEKHFVDLNEDSDYDSFETQIEKHMAHISNNIAQGYKNTMEGYGDINKIVKNFTIYTGYVEYDTASDGLREIEEQKQ